MNGELRIYVACLASYNNGRLHGAWIDCEGKDAEELRIDVATMLRTSPYPNVMVPDPDSAIDGPGEQSMVPSAEEWAIHDSEGFGRMVGESTSLDDVAMITEALSGNQALAFRWLIEDRGMTVSEAAERADEVDIWQNDRGQSDERMLADYAEEFTDETGGLEGCPEHFRNYIDFEMMGRDLRLSGDVDLTEIDGTRFIVTNAAQF